jgi:hypothetical protein
MLSVQPGWPLTTPFGYEWLREGSAISGATVASYMVQSAGSYSLAAGSHGTVALRLTGPGAKAMLAARHGRLAGKLAISVKGGTTIARMVVAALAKR